jgi:ArsR family transcriptional regulator, arsenate/arsenite/antimonite-responsive transcriptional repressor / arsenate reductase (thioredoxin)
MTNTAQHVAPAFLKLLAHDVRWQILTALARGDLRVQELVAVVGKPINLVSYHLRQLREQAIVHERHSSADGRDVYYTLNLAHLNELYRRSGAQLHPALGPRIDPVQQSGKRQPLRVLFLCTQNRARSQLAEGILRSLGEGHVEVASAGVRPGVVHPLAIQTLADMGIDISAQHSKHIDEVQDQTFDLVITVCDQMREVCPALPGFGEYIHWSVEDPIAAAEKAGDEETRRQIFAKTAHELTTRIRFLLLAEANRSTAYADAVPLG